MAIEYQTLKPIEKQREAEDATLGEDIIHLLRLEKHSNGRVDTTWGNKTPAGLTRTLRRLLNDGDD